MHTPRAGLLILGLLVPLALLAACAVPLGPGYHLRQEALEVRYQPGGAPVLRVHARAEMVNVGNAPLAELTVKMPQRLEAGTEPVTLINGRAVTPVLRSREGESRLTVPIDPPLAQRRSLSVSLEYEIPTASPEFALDPGAWFVRFAPPNHLFAKGGAWANKTELGIFVPSGYRVLTTGTKRSVRPSRKGGPTEYRFEIRQQDFPPFLVAGKFVRRRIRAEGRDVIFWTIEPLDAGCAQIFATRLAATANLYRSRFGRLAKHAAQIPVVQVPAGHGSLASSADEFGSVPGGVLFSVAPPELCREPQRFFPAAERALAATWFGWTLAPEPDARAFLVGGVRRYAMLLAEEGGSPAAARQRLVKHWLAEYDRLESGAKPIAPAALQVDSPAAERKMAGIQSALFLIALQDRFGPVAIGNALAHLISSLRNSTAGLDDVRSALEEATGRNLFGLFQEWLGRPGIPKTFRQRYSAAAAKPADETKQTLNARRAR